MTETIIARVFQNKSKCPFCGGTKTKPFVRAFANQNCTDCDKNGHIGNKKLRDLGLDEYIKKH